MLEPCSSGSLSHGGVAEIVPGVSCLMDTAPLYPVGELGVDGLTLTPRRAKESENAVSVRLAVDEIMFNLAPQALRILLSMPWAIYDIMKEKDIRPSHGIAALELTDI
eukprot:3119524-Amphidinium_carterae.1